MIKVIIKREKRVSKFNVGDKVMYKHNLLIVEIKKVIKSRKGIEYLVFYPHLEKPQNTFPIDESELKEKPINYNDIIFNAYIDYRYKYYDLLKKLHSPKWEGGVKNG